MLEASQKAVLERHIESLGELQAMTPENNEAHAKPTLIAVSKMLMTLAGRESGDLAASAKGEAYMAALDDVAFWAVEEAARRWYRGECGPGHDYRWVPAPAILRELAQLEEWRVRAVSSNLRKLVDAKPVQEFSQEHRARMKERLREQGIGTHCGIGPSSV